MKTNILKRLDFIITAEPTKLANLGNCQIYTMNRDVISHIPHVHVCIRLSQNTKNFNGKPFDGKGNSIPDLLTILTVGLKFSNEPYTLENIDIEESWKNENKVGFGKILKSVVKWLNTWNSKAKMRNGDLALLKYADSHKSTGWIPYKKEFDLWIAKLKNGTAFENS